jgi:pyrimidine-specific ribonucleoside hydrolase
MEHSPDILLKALIFQAILFSTVVGALAQPIPTITTCSVVIETDCAVDDLRAITMLLSIPDITVNALVATDGTIPPSEGVIKLNALLDTWFMKPIPVIEGRELSGINPPWREFNRNVKWGNSKINKSESQKSLAQILQDSPDKVVFICLGPLSDVADLVKNYKTKIERIIWYNESVNPLKGFNYSCDAASALSMLHSGIRMDVISGLGNREAIFGNAMLSACNGQDNAVSNAFKSVFIQPEANKRLNENHFGLWDDMVAVYLLNPELFDMNIIQKNVKIRYNTGYNLKGIEMAIEDIIKGRYKVQDQIVFNSFPSEQGQFRYDIREIMDTVIRLYGPEEWKANVMTDEFHGHLGVFSIVGAKMGIKARELFGVGPDMLSVVSDAGSKPPYSCLNDGIQVSTGATLGMGLIKLSEDSIFRPSAVFTYNNRSIRLTLKKEYLERVNADIQEGIVKFGLMDDGYWKLIRRNAIRYWLEWDRNMIFDVE